MEPVRVFALTVLLASWPACDASEPASSAPGTDAATSPDTAPATDTREAADTRSATEPATHATDATDAGASTEATDATVTSEVFADTATDVGPDSPVFTDTVAMFHLNVQDHGYLERSAAVVARVMDLFESLGLRLDIYLTTWMVDDFERAYPDLLQRILTSSWVSVNYHTRPPLPYRANFQNAAGDDWYGLSKMSEDTMVTEISAYEAQGLDLTTGQRTSAEGGFAKLTRLYGRAPYVGGIESSGQTMQRAVDRAFSALGVSFVIQHMGNGTFEGDTRNGIPVKPEAIDAKVFNSDPALDGDTCVSMTDGADIYDCEIARCTRSSRGPCTVAFKMHDNDFFAEDSWWLTVYAKKSPPWDPTKLSPLLSESAQDAMWSRYEAIVRRAAARRAEIGIVGARDWLTRADGE